MTATRYYEHARMFECLACRVLIVGKESVTAEQCALCGQSIVKSRPVRILILRGIHRPVFDESGHEELPQVGVAPTVE